MCARTLLAKRSHDRPFGAVNRAAVCRADAKAAADLLIDQASMASSLV
jgi:hypothetical protein